MIFCPVCKRKEDVSRAEMEKAWWDKHNDGLRSIANNIVDQILMESRNGQ